MRPLVRSIFLPTSIDETLIRLHNAKIEVGNMELFMPNESLIDEGFVFNSTRRTMLVSNAFLPSVFMKGYETMQGVQLCFEFSKQDSYFLFIILVCLVQFLGLVFIKEHIAFTVIILSAGILNIIIAEMTFRLECYRFLQEFSSLFSNISGTGCTKE